MDLNAASSWHHRPETKVHTGIHDQDRTRTGPGYVVSTDVPQFPHKSVYAALVAPSAAEQARARPTASREAFLITVTAIDSAICAVLLYSVTPPP